jgi:hypothetical protein
MPQQVVGQSYITSYTLGQCCMPVGAYDLCPNRSSVNPVSPRIHWANAVPRIHWANTGRGQRSVLNYRVLGEVAQVETIRDSGLPEFRASVSTHALR